MFLLNENTHLLVQGITGTQGQFHTKAMQDYGTKIVAGVTPNKGGTQFLNIPIYNTVKEAIEAHPEINATILFVPARFCKDAIFESIHMQITLLTIITEGLPILDSMEILNDAKKRDIYIIGPNSPGIISPKYKCKVGIMPSGFFPRGNVGICSRSGTLSYEIALHLKNSKKGISTAIGIGGDPLIGPTIVDVLQKFEEDKDTKVIVLIGEIGGNLEEASAKCIKEEISKPVIGYIAGRTINLKEKRFGHAGAFITSSGVGTAKHKIEVLESAGVDIARYPAEIETLIRKY
jgi:succinyl-CoA synthetase alpha subunit